MSEEVLKIALIHDVFFGDDGPERLARRLGEARAAGADLALLPELPVDPWVPASRSPRDEDAEPPEGPRHRLLADAARRAGIGVAGGAITVDSTSGRRRNRMLLFDGSGRLVGRYDKLHVPDEEGYWEAAHYDGGDEPPAVIAGFAMPIGLQICSDLFRPQGCHYLGALGAEVILAPRCTPATSYERWRAMICADAITSSAYVLSTNRPRPERGVPIGGPSVAAAPDGSVLSETTDAVTVLSLERSAVARARADYPGYLPVRPELYARAWGSLVRDD